MILLRIVTLEVALQKTAGWHTWVGWHTGILMIWSLHNIIYIYAPRKLTCQWTTHHFKMHFLLKMGIFYCHLGFQGCICNYICNCFGTSTSKFRCFLLPAAILQHVSPCKHMRQFWTLLFRHWVPVVYGSRHWPSSDAQPWKMDEKQLRCFLPKTMFVKRQCLKHIQPSNLQQHCCCFGRLFVNSDPFAIGVSQGASDFRGAGCSDDIDSCKIMSITPYVMS